MFKNSKKNHQIFFFLRFIISKTSIKNNKSYEAFNSLLNTQQIISFVNKKDRHQKLMSTRLKIDLGTKNLKSKLRSEVSNIIWYITNTEKPGNDLIHLSKHPHDKKRQISTSFLTIHSRK